MNLKTFQYVQCRAVDNSDTGVKIPLCKLQSRLLFSRVLNYKHLQVPSNNSFLRQTFLSNDYVAMLKC